MRNSEKVSETTNKAKGFTLIASLLLLLLLSGIAIGLMMMVNTEGKVGSSDLQNNIAYHSAEGGIEKMTSDLASTFQNAQAPSPQQICDVGLPATNGPTLTGVTWKDYMVRPGTLATSCPSSLTTPVQIQQWGRIQSGPDQGLSAQIIPISMMATADYPGGQEVSMMRTAQVALIPVFQFGVFSDSDLAFFPGSNLDFAGRVHTNGDLYPLAGTGATVTFHAKISAFGNIIRTQLPNGWGTSSNYTGTVYVPSSDGDCSSPGTASTGHCTAMSAVTTSYGSGSVTGAGSTTAQTGSSYNGTVWNPFSSGTNSEIINGNYGSTTTPGTGAKKLSLPFVGGGALPNEIIHRPLAGESASTSLGASREYNMAQIRVLLSDDPADLPTGSVRLANITTTEATATGGTASNAYGIAIATIPPAVANGYIPATLATPGAGKNYTLYFAAGTNTFLPDPTTCGSVACPTQTCGSGSTPPPCNPQTLTADWPKAPATPSASARTLVPTGPPAAPVLAAGATPAPTFSLCPPGNVSSSNLPSGCSAAVSSAAPYFVIGNSGNASSWNLIDGYLYVGYKDASGNWNNVTNEWLKLGFARGTAPPTAPGTNPINPNGILLLQQPTDRNGLGGVPDTAGLAPACLTWNNPAHTTCLTWNNPRPPEVLTDAGSTSPYFGQSLTTGTAPVAGSTLNAAQQSISMYNWYPINFYDVREGEVRDVTVSDTSCTVNGVMNAVEIDVGNLNRWLTGASGTSGTSVDYLAQNGYVLYFSDRRGMLNNPNAPYSGTIRSGDAGLEDVINSQVSGGTPDGVLDPIPSGRTFSPEDVNENGFLDNWGTQNMGLGFWNGSTNLNAQIIAATPDNTYSPRVTNCGTIARKNWVSGARHALKLVDGAFPNVPHRTDAAANLASPGGFTVASENPVYIQGNYNTNAADWAGGVDQTGHAAAAVIADAVTMLSNDWDDRKSITGNVTTLSQRNPSQDGYYRVAVAGGKNMAFAQPSGTGQDFGTDGGLHNFLRYIEDWSGQTFHYKGSLVSLYFSTYNTGIFKCCTVVYGVPSRDFAFDSDFSTPGGLPPGTPMFRDVNSLSYRQMFTARTK